MTYPNPNVLFELGYAIARSKRVWITLDTSIPDSTTNYRKLEVLTTVGYASYHNSQGLVDKFYADRPYERLTDTIYRGSIASILQTTLPPGIFYLKSAVNTQASLRLTAKLADEQVPVLTYDPYETGTEPLTGYIQRIHASIGVIAHLLDETRGRTSLQNAKYSLISGLAYGLDKPLLMLAHSPYEHPPLDYRDLLYVHATASDCLRAATPWLSKVTPEYATRLARYQQYQVQSKRNKELRDVDLGNYVAEDESLYLGNYFIETAQYQEALRGPKAAIFVGRKGSGKSANFYRVAEQRRKDSRFFVCPIRPVEYELEGIVDLLRNDVPGTDKGHTIQTFWKLLIYTELAREVYLELAAKPAHYRRNHPEEELYTYVEAHSEHITTNFAARMQQAIAAIQTAMHATGDANVSEVLHEHIIERLRSLLGYAFEKKSKVFILVDNLDRTWGRNDSLPDLSQFLLGLLSAASTIADEFQRSGPEWRKVDLSLIVFLRADIFEYIRKTAVERDKVPAIEMQWEDRRLLARIVEERVFASAGTLTTPEEVWSRLFTPTVGNMPTRDYLLQRIVPRPRDIIFWCKYALNNAINGQHIIIEEDDVTQAEQEYSRYAVESLVTENVVECENIEKVLYEFYGQKQVLTHNQVRRIVRVSGLAEAEVKDTIKLLYEVGFLALETKPNEFTPIYDRSRIGVVEAAARRTEGLLKAQRFSINTPYHTHLAIEPGIPELSPPASKTGSAKSRRVQGRR